MTSTLQLQCLKKGGRFTLRHLPQRHGLIGRHCLDAGTETTSKSSRLWQKHLVHRTNKFSSRDENLKFAHYPLCALAAGLSYGHRTELVEGGHPVHRSGDRRQICLSLCHAVDHEDKGMMGIVEVVM
jgi:hypothetical protein